MRAGLRRATTLAVSTLDVETAARYARANKAKRVTPLNANWPICQKCKDDAPTLFLAGEAAMAHEERYLIDRVNLEHKHTGKHESWCDIRAWHHGEEDVKRVRVSRRVDWDTPAGELELRRLWRALVFFHNELTRERA